MAGPPTRSVLPPAVRASRSRWASWRMAAPLGFSVETALSMKANGCGWRERASGKASRRRAQGRSRRRGGPRSWAGSGRFRRSRSECRSPSPGRDRRPPAGQADFRALVRGAIKALGECAVDVGGDGRQSSCAVGAAPWSANWLTISANVWRSAARDLDQSVTGVLPLLADIDALDLKRAAIVENAAECLGRSRLSMIWPRSSTSSTASIVLGAPAPDGDSS